VSVFVDSYLRLSEDERRLFDKELVRVAPEERGKVMELTTSWKEEGRQEGRQEATLEMVLRLLGRRLGALPEDVRERVVALRLADLEALGEDLLDFHVNLGEAAGGPAPRQDGQRMSTGARLTTPVTAAERVGSRAGFPVSWAGGSSGVDRSEFNDRPQRLLRPAQGGGADVPREPDGGAGAGARTAQLRCVAM
jgi:hypothetical protein